jgi:hypothetical protein
VGAAEYEGGAEYEEYEAYSEPEFDESEPGPEPQSPEPEPEPEPETPASDPQPAAGITFVTAEPEGEEDGDLPGLTFTPCGCPHAE